MRRQTSRKLAEMKQDKKFAAWDWKMLNKYLPDSLLEELDEKNKTNIHQQLAFNSDPTLISSSERIHKNPSGVTITNHSHCLSDKVNSRQS